MDDRNKAAKEVLKHITKCADFCDRQEMRGTVLYDATKGARLIQTFGTWYGVNFDAPEAFDPDWLENWGETKCCVRRN